MRKNRTVLMLFLIFLFGTIGCSIIPQGNGGLEIYAGIRTTQIGLVPPKLTIESTVVDKLVDLLLDGKVTEAE